ncbi:MAG: aminotransferase class V-fold PLP-dependent enzyme, partial [Maritimibacter sp.]
MTTAAAQLDQFDRFKASLDRADLIENLRDGMIGEGIEVPGPNGSHPLIYADYVASGRALRQIEEFMVEEILPIYANSHTEASFCGQMMTRLRRQARQIILDSCGGNDEYDVIFTGSGATAGLNRLVGLLGVDATGPQGQKPLVLIGPYEHHSNILPWRESGAQIIEIPEAATGGPDMGTLEAVLTEHKGRRIVGAFSAMSNVTGIVTDVKQVTRLLKAHGAISVWDYAGGAPYLPIDVAGDAEAQIDAVALSPHKFIGGPGASGVLILRRDAVARAKPTLPGGGTVRFVSPW